MKLKSTFALLDVMRGHSALNRLIPARSHDIPQDKRVPVTIRGYITGRYGSHDGVSQEFVVEVTSVDTGESA